MSTTIAVATEPAHAGTARPPSAIGTQHFFILYRPGQERAPWPVAAIRDALARLMLARPGSWHVAEAGPLLVGWLGDKAADMAAPFLLHAGDLVEPQRADLARLVAGHHDGMLDGTLAACAVDPLLGRACLYTDLFGLFPLYRAERDGTCGFATSLRLLTGLLKPLCHVDRAALYEMLGFHLVLGNRTLLREIELVPPATALRLHGGPAEASTWWDWHHLEPAAAAPADIVPATYALIEKAVLRSIRGARKIAVSLSGGLDSRLLAAVLARNGVPFQTYNIDFGHETQIARQVAQSLGVPFKVLPMWPHPARIMFEGHEAMDCAYHVNQVWGWEMAEEAARDGCDLVLDGLAFDTILGAVHRVKGDTAAALADGLKGNYQEIDVHTLGRVVGTETARAIQDSLDRSMLAQAEECLRAAGPRASEHFTMTNRIRRYTFGYSLANLQHLRGAYPYVTRELFEHCMRLPLELRLEHRLYRRIYCELFPELARIPWAKTLQPLDRYAVPRELSVWYRRLIAVVRRLTLGRVALWGKGDFDEAFRARAAVREPFLTRLGRPGMMNQHGGLPDTTMANVLWWQHAGRNYAGFMQALFTVENFLVRQVREGHVALVT